MAESRHDSNRRPPILDQFPRRRTALGLVAVAALILLYFMLTGPVQYPDRWARYAFPEGSPIPGATSLVLSLPSIDTHGQDATFWWRMQVEGLEGNLFAIDLQTRALDFLYPGALAVHVDRYLLEPSGADPIEYVDAGSGGARLRDRCHR